ncbi:hypothetical protein FA95DRAFT_1567970 [Auriscalpium vulgare]|uniref:Uncharacterized protein n=1 Tax=Auriscalpium vulgare TaxID=40419 RepID=A0ACB8R221_9AGAM|nr:hypothetical protein FA95DRAFT_1567970 [Auriscalpium vulgare]
MSALAPHQAVRLRLLDRVALALPAAAQLLARHGAVDGADKAHALVHADARLERAVRCRLKGALRRWNQTSCGWRCTSGSSGRAVAPPRTARTAPDSRAQSPQHRSGLTCATGDGCDCAHPGGVTQARQLWGPTKVVGETTHKHPPSRGFFTR